VNSLDLEHRVSLGKRIILAGSALALAAAAYGCGDGNGNGNNYSKLPVKCQENVQSVEGKVVLYGLVGLKMGNCQPVANAEACHRYRAPGAEITLKDAAGNTIKTVANDEGYYNAAIRPGISYEIVWTGRVDTPTGSVFAIGANVYDEPTRPAGENLCMPLLQDTSIK